MINNQNDKKNSVNSTEGERGPFQQAITKGLIFGFLFSVNLFLCGPLIQESGYKLLLPTPTRVPYSENNNSGSKKELRRLEKRIRELKYRLNRLTPQDPYMIINTSENLFVLKCGRRVLYQGICSTGSYTLLKTYDDKEEWIFKTPRGRFRVHNILEDPIWRMPDWAFVEEGLPVPPPNASERFEFGALGDYAFDIGNGYLIHGTLYQRFLGLPVTHGCVRLGDRALKVVHNNLSLGSKVYIY